MVGHVNIVTLRVSSVPRIHCFEFQLLILCLYTKDHRIGHINQYELPRGGSGRFTLWRTGVDHHPRWLRWIGQPFRFMASPLSFATPETGLLESISRGNSPPGQKEWATHHRQTVIWNCSIVSCCIVRSIFMKKLSWSLLPYHSAYRARMRSIAIVSIFRPWQKVRLRSKRPGKPY